MREARKKQQNNWRTMQRLSIYLLIIVGLCVGVIWAKNLVLSRQVQFVSSQEGVLATPVEVTALVVNSEQVVTTPAAGKLNKLTAQGDRVRGDSPVLKISVETSGKQIVLNSPAPGLVNYYIDGQEGIATINNLLQWDLNKFSGIKANPTAKETVQSGQAVFKITDNLTPTYLFFKLSKPGVNISQGESITLQFDGYKFNGKVVRLSDQGPGGGMVVALNSFLNQSLGKRSMKLNWLDRNQAKGQILPTTAITQKKGACGVYVIKDGVVNWRQVKILARNQDQVCVQGLTTGTPVISTPGSVREGQILNN